jgi:hypothetical protein
MAQSLQASSVSPDGDIRPRPLWRGVRGLKERHALRAGRRTADRELLRREHPPLRLAWRVEELVTPKNRLDLAHSIQSLVRDANPRYLPTASPVNRLAVRAEAETLLAVAARLGDLERPVAARGVLLVERLLVDGSGPLYDRELVDDLPAYLDSALTALVPH